MGFRVLGALLGIPINRFLHLRTDAARPNQQLRSNSRRHSNTMVENS